MPDVGDQRAEARSRVEALYASHADELRRFVLGVVRDPEVAADVIQATLSKALEQGHTARVESLKGWLFRVAFHEAMAARRQKLAGDRARRKFADFGLARGADTTAPDRPVLLSETVAAVRQALGSLPKDQRRVVMARVYDDKTFAQIARENGLPLGTVLTRMRLALNKLRSALDTETGR